MKVITNSPEETMQLAKKIADRCYGGEIILLNGDLGAGKTTFTKGLAKALGIEADVTSPTFMLMKSYKGGRLELYHFDFYRIENIDEVEELGFDDIFNDGGICVIEWNKLSFSNKKIIKINFLYGENTKRIIEIEGL